MAALAGVWFFDGRPVGEECRALVTALQPLAPDGVSVVADRGLAMLHGAFDVWTGERSTEQPLRSPAGLVMTWDGRLDNRDDLILRLGGTLAGGASDAAIAAAVFERWGVEGLRSLIGDWSIAIWDGRARTLHLARDYMGVRPLYYYADSHAVIWSSSLGELAIRADRVEAIDERFIARFMALRFSTDVTPYHGIRAVPTATCVSFSRAGTETRQRFWRLEPGLIRYRDRRQYEEHLRELWMQAVGSRLRTEGTVWAELSGGLDSSSVVCMADALIKAGRVAAAAIQPLSYVTFRSPEGDERRFIAEVEARIDARSHIIGVEEHAEDGDAVSDWVTPLAARGVALASRVAVGERGGRLILSGRVGDTIMGCTPDNSLAVLDDLADWRPVRAVANMRDWSRACRKPFVEIGWCLLQETLTSRLPHAWRTLREGGRWAGRELLTPRLRSTLTGDPDYASLPYERPVGRISQRPLAAALLAYSLDARLGGFGETNGVTLTYPFAHRPLVDYMLAIPAEELSGPGDIRSLMRRAFHGLVPARILGRISKGYYPPSVMRGVRPRAASMLPVETLEAVRRGWLDPVAVDAAIRTLIDGGGTTGAEVRHIQRLEDWLESRKQRGPAAKPQRKEVITHAVLDA